MSKKNTKEDTSTKVICIIITLIIIFGLVHKRLEIVEQQEREKYCTLTVTKLDSYIEDYPELMPDGYDYEFDVTITSYDEDGNELSEETLGEGDSVSVMYPFELTVSVCAQDGTSSAEFSDSSSRYIGDRIDLYSTFEDQFIWEHDVMAMPQLENGGYGEPEAVTVRVIFDSMIKCNENSDIYIDESTDLTSDESGYNVEYNAEYEADADADAEEKLTFEDNQTGNILEPIRDTEMTWKNLSVEDSYLFPKENLYYSDDGQERFFTVRCNYSDIPEWLNGHIYIISHVDCFDTEYELEGTSSVKMDEVVMEIPSEYAIGVSIDKDHVVESVYNNYHGEITYGKISVDSCTFELIWDELNDNDNVLTGEIYISAYIEYITPNFETNTYETDSLEYSCTIDVEVELLDYYYE